MAEPEFVVIREHEGGAREYLEDHRGGSGSDVWTWNADVTKAWRMPVRTAQRYASLSYVPAWADRPPASDCARVDQEPKP